MSLESYLSKYNVWHRFITKTETIHTSDAARAVGIPLYKITKNLVSITDSGEYLLLIVPGDKKVNLKNAAKTVGVKVINLVPFERAEKISGYPPGGTPSIGHKTNMRVIIEKKLLDYDTIYCGGGSRDKLLELKVQDILKMSNAIIAEIVQ